MHTVIWYWVFLFNTNNLLLVIYFQVFLSIIDNYILSWKVKLATLVEGDPKAPFSIATTPRCRGGRYYFPWIAPLYPWSLPYNAECQAKYHFMSLWYVSTWDWIPVFQTVGGYSTHYTNYNYFIIFIHFHSYMILSIIIEWEWFFNRSICPLAMILTVTNNFVWVNLWIIALKGFSKFSRSPEMEPHYCIQFSVIEYANWGDLTPQS